MRGSLEVFGPFIPAAHTTNRSFRWQRKRQSTCNMHENRCKPESPLLFVMLVLLRQVVPVWHRLGSQYIIYKTSCRSESRSHLHGLDKITICQVFALATHVMHSRSSTLQSFRISLSSVYTVPRLPFTQRSRNAFYPGEMTAADQCN